MDLLQAATPELVAELMDMFGTTDLREIERRLRERDYPPEDEVVLDEVRDSLIRALATSIPVQEVPSYPTRNPTIPNTRPLNDHNPYSYLTTDMLRIILRARDINAEGNRSNLIDILTSAQGHPYWYRQLSYEEFSRLEPEKRGAYLFYQAGKRGIDFTRAPYGQLSFAESVELILAILYERFISPMIAYLAVKYLYPQAPAETYNREQLMRALYGAPPPANPILQRRYRHLISQSRDVINMYASAHRVEEPALIWKLVQAAPIPLEAYIDLVTDLQGARHVASALGIVVPPDQDIVSYVRANIRAYRRVVSDPSTPDTDRQLTAPWTGSTRELVKRLIRYTDEDLFSLIGVYVYYTSRDNLIATVGTLLEEDIRFFIPLRPCPNGETYYGTLTSSVPVVAYGTLYEYRCYEEEEFLANIREFPFSMKIPGTQQIMNRRQIEVLRDTISRFNFPQLSQRIREGLLELADPTLRIPFQRLTQNERDSVRNFLLAMFRTGMYMRRWTGSGCYPVTEASTRANIDPEPRSLQGLMELNSIYENASLNTRHFLDTLQMRKRNSFLEYTFMERFRVVLAGDSVDSCIRLNSAKFIFTAYYYLEQLFSYLIPDFSPQDLELIA